MVGVRGGVEHRAKRVMELVTEHVTESMTERVMEHVMEHTAHHMAVESTERGSKSTRTHRPLQERDLGGLRPTTGHFLLQVPQRI